MTRHDKTGYEPHGVCKTNQDAFIALSAEKDRPAQSLEPPWGRASLLQRCSGSAATEQDLCKTVIATSKVNWATTVDCVVKP